MKFKVTNLTKDERRFRDRNGVDVLVGAGKTAITDRPPKGSNIWKVQAYTEETEEIKLKKEVISKMEKKKMLSDK